MFHWKQAIKRKLSALKLKNEKEIFEYAMIKFSINILTVIPIHEIRKNGIPFVQDNLKDSIHQDDDFPKMNTFWNYFENFWMSSEKFIETWNINDYQGNKNILKFTNNGLESYNKRLKGLFCAGTPSLPIFFIQ